MILRSKLAQAAAMLIPLLATAAAPAPHRLTVAIVGQSNEAGTGKVRTGPFPHAEQQEPIPPSGGFSSIWEPVEETAGQRGVAMWFWNSAVGATSITHNWSGTLSAWRPDMLVTRGDYMLVDGRIYQDVMPADSSPLIPSVVRPQDGRTTDGVLWHDTGPATAADVPGRVYRPGDRRFDPNGYVARALSGLSRHPGAPWVFISIGQGDAGTYWTVTREQYSQGLIAVTDAALAAGAHVAIGFTSGTARPSSEAAYAEKLIPGWGDALAHYRGDPRVIEGANLRLALGPLRVTPDGTPGLRPDQIHMNDAEIPLAARAWVAALTRAGVLPPGR